MVGASVREILVQPMAFMCMLGGGGEVPPQEIQNMLQAAPKTVVRWSQKGTSTVATETRNPSWQRMK